jgi:hypothetical protein
MNLILMGVTFAAIVIPASVMLYFDWRADMAAIDRAEEHLKRMLTNRKER